MLKMDDTTGEIPVLICTTAVKLAFNIAGYLETKQVSILRKPFSSRDLIRAVHAALRNENVASIDTAKVVIDGKPPKPPTI